MVETVKTPKAPEMTKRAKWEKIKKELLRLPGIYPEITGIVISPEYDAIIIVVRPVSSAYELNLYREGRKLRKLGIDFARFEVYNLDNFSEGFSWRDHFDSKFKIIYDK